MKGCDLTKPPSAHVVELCTEEECGQNVDNRENNPENHISFPKHLQTFKMLICRHSYLLSKMRTVCKTHHSQYRKEDDHSQAGVGSVSTCIDVWVSLLIQLQHTQPSNHVHERGVCKQTACTPMKRVFAD